MKKISIAPSEMWDYFVKNKERLNTVLDKVAENSEFGVDIYITAEENMPRLFVMADNICVANVTIPSKNRCEEICNDTYIKYLTHQAIDILSGDLNDDTSGIDLTDPDMHELSKEGIEQLIEEREEELSIAVMDFLYTVTDSVYEEASDLSSDVIDDIKDDILKLLYKKYKISPRRPMILEFQDGSEKFFVYPYDDLDLD